MKSYRLFLIVLGVVVIVLGGLLKILHVGFSSEMLVLGILLCLSGIASMFLAFIFKILER